jgi:hypothetical protein
MPGKTTALQDATQGKKKITDKQAHSALGEATGKIASLTRRMGRNKENVMEAGVLVLHTAETQGSLFLSSMAEGYFGSHKLKVGGLDARAPAALLLEGYGLYETLSGHKGGGHALAIGNGLLGSWLASVAVNAGRTLAEKKGQPVQQLAPPVVLTQGMPANHLLGGPNFLADAPMGGPVREVMLTPEPAARGASDESTEGRFRRGGGGRGGRVRGPGMRRPNRFRQDEEEDEA